MIAYADCSAGVSGDMFLAACLDLGLPLDHLAQELAKVDLTGYDLETGTEIRQGLAGRRFKVSVHAQKHARHWSDIRALIHRSDVSEGVKGRALAVFERLAHVEARMHGISPEQVHFHEVGAVDSIVDVVGAAIAWEYFGLERLYASPLPVGTGWVESAHGRLPLPAPATLALLENVPVYGSGVEAELVTPTGAALLTTLAHRFGDWPAMTVLRVGHGAGSRELPDRPNILRLVLGRATVEAALERLVVAETNLDDMNPEILPYLMERLFRGGALDVWLTPIQMKKGRPAVQLSVLARPAEVDPLLDIILTESTTLGVRTYPVDRRALARETRTLRTPWGEIAVKSVRRGGKTELIPEFEACRRIAEQTRRPLKEIYAEVAALAADEPAE